MSWTMLQPFVVIEPRRRREYVEAKAGSAGGSVVWPKGLFDAGSSSMSSVPKPAAPATFDDGIPAILEDDSTIPYGDHPELVLAAILKDVA